MDSEPLPENLTKKQNTIKEAMFITVSSLID